MFARRLAPYTDGHKGEPMGKWLRVVDIRDHCPIDGPRRAKCVFKLSNGTWEFVWNLQLTKEKMVGPQLTLFE